FFYGLAVQTFALPFSYSTPRRRSSYSDLVLEELLRRGVEYVALAGFMRLLGGELLRRYAGRIVNIHPSLLPAFPGLEPQRQALRSEERRVGTDTTYST